ncbi:hypothetical protein CARUB_v10011051mg [Capsella rubella]|uniref:Uncharacterized protein n=1 Tax=Capsella rubella TaxID=81985 RepID=R0GL18_9BRAS|nr:uncharacterized protein LOC17900287 [Capsella rubella]EOA36461.1 hypothetical protein CARUB_v10011051mg [Capsella rubella]
MDNDGVVEIREEEEPERREELRRSAVTLLVAVAFHLLTLVGKRSAGFVVPDPYSGTEKNGHWALYWASKFIYRMAELSCLTVIVQLILSTIATVVVMVGREREQARHMRRLRISCNRQLFLGFICFTISLALSAYLRCFV